MNSYVLDYQPLLDRIIDLALLEDIGPGDLATQALVPQALEANATIVSKANGIVCGTNIAKRVFQKIDPKVKWVTRIQDGKPVSPGETIAQITGPYHALLTGERTALNFMQRMCGIATATSQLVKILEGTNTQILDTRKTAPGMRQLDKMAVRHGGGANHRLGLYDLAMIKDNHIALAGGIPQAVQAVRKSIPAFARIEVETSNREQVVQALNAGADIIMLDNMNLEDMAWAVHLIKGAAKTEASGNMTGDRLYDVARCGVDYISVGALTHSVKALDISMRMQPL